MPRVNPYVELAPLSRSDLPQEAAHYGNGTRALDAGQRRSELISSASEHEAKFFVRVLVHEQMVRLQTRLAQHRRDGRLCELVRRLGP